jgi:hypothetical protein
MIDLDQEFGIAMEAIGGQRLGTLPKGTFKAENADFLFPESGVIAELKCLDRDTIADQKIVEKASAIYAEALKARATKKIAFGTVYMTSDDLSEEFGAKFRDLYSVPIARVLKKADGQIEATRAALNLYKAQGLLLLANNANSALHPPNARDVLGTLLRESDSFPNIDHVVYFTANMFSEFDGWKAHVWYSAGRRGHPDMSEHFLRKVRKAWFAHHERLVGEPITTLFPPREAFEGLENARPGRKPPGRA